MPLSETLEGYVHRGICITRAQKLLGAGSSLHCWHRSEELCCMDIPGGSVVKNPLPMQEMWIWSLGQEDPLEKEMVTCVSSISCIAGRFFTVWTTRETLSSLWCKSNEGLYKYPPSLTSWLVTFLVVQCFSGWCEDCSNVHYSTKPRFVA